MSDLTPAFTRDNPIMQAAFADFMRYLWGLDKAHQAHCKATGLVRIPAPKTQIERMIHDATGCDSAYAESFLRWAIDTLWGVEGRDDQEDGA